MSAFASYARYYDMLYRNKSYAAEAEYVVGLLNRYAPAARTILDVGCGTGSHARELVHGGYAVHGVDVSPEMLGRAHVMRDGLAPDAAERLAFSLGDAREFSLDRRFDAVISLFHVMSYQTSNRDLLSAFASVRNHLADGGAFIFDCWYGPAVLTDRPKVVTKKVTDGDLSLERLSEPVLDAQRNVVEVHYTLTASDASPDDAVREQHDMRYLFTPEVEMMLAANDLELVESFEWMSEKVPDFDSWNVCYIARG